MINAIRSEWVLLNRRRLWVVLGVITTAFTVLATWLLLETAEPASLQGNDGITLEAIRGAGGATAAVVSSMIFSSVLVLAAFISSTANEFTARHAPCCLHQGAAAACRCWAGRSPPAIGVAVDRDVGGARHRLGDGGARRAGCRCRQDRLGQRGGALVGDRGLRPAARLRHRLRRDRHDDRGASCDRRRSRSRSACSGSARSRT